jgi:hypothetical protein
MVASPLEGEAGIASIDAIPGEGFLSAGENISTEFAETAPSPERVCVSERSCPLPQGAGAQ